MLKSALIIACCILLGSCSNSEKSEESAKAVPTASKGEPDTPSPVTHETVPDEPALPPPDLPSIDSGAILKLEARAASNGSWFVAGQTNLPEDTPVEIGISGIQWFGGGDETIKHGRFRASLEDAPDGLYTATATVIISDPNAQPIRSSQAFPGQRVREEDGEIWVETEISFFIGQTREAALDADNAFKERIRQYNERLALLYEQGEKTMGKLRRAGSNEDKRKCIQMLQENKGSIKSIIGELEKIPLPVPSISELRVGASHLLGCSTCSDEYATRSCRFAKEELDKARKAIKKW